MEVYLRANEGALRLLHQAAVVRPSRYPPEPDETCSVATDVLLGLRKAGYLLQLEGVCRADAGDAVGTVESAVASFALAHSLRNEPHPLPQLIAAAIDSLSIRTVEHALSRLPLAEVQKVVAVGVCLDDLHHVAIRASRTR